MNVNGLRISIIQLEIIWEDKEKNIKNYQSFISQLKGKSDLVVLPEMFATGFSVSAKHLPETNTDKIMQTILSWSRVFDLAISSSFLAKDKDGNLFNRGFFATPEGKIHFSDKRHLFRMSEEIHLFNPGENYNIIPYKNWNIRLIICYDLRFPVWTRNKNNEYDLLLCVANWPKTRSNSWEILLKARSIENLCYTCGVNRIGHDGNNISYQGGSMLLNFKGEIILEAGKDQESALTTTIYKEKLQDFRNKFPIWKDADSFNFS
ncbi:MAG: amidohydrolase [Candidatus Azobacteroides pseudotrichonymphae]|jgi:predicted amidohydrolase|uniref:Omega-amidase YafV n=1 Tax=Azobacteroides pseudotrichonymphae genomovar. CFP2 TaxID=511995 RepID=B6YRV4_AZOPC|nr:amidohydrolase [Candidatus Azobacteroides pseudotrichonymphae]BAG83926.1 putative amidohydrolase [Candidatus Azobacteroides pseudotrichonymphae genomovar. CFP2]GMO33224.1 MAG: amidohydrolase [Candidatus Azobacteroides pseudotrichonymphae]